jgi:hypothetical protein
MTRWEREHGIPSHRREEKSATRWRCRPCDSQNFSASDWNLNEGVAFLLSHFMDAQFFCFENQQTSRQRLEAVLS